MGFFKKKKHNKASMIKNKSQNQENWDISLLLTEVKKAFKNYFGNQEDIIYRTFTIQNMNQRKGMLIFMSDITNQEWISQQIIKPLKEINLEQINSNESVMEQIKETILTTGDISISNHLMTVFDDLLSGRAILFLENESSAISIAVGDWASRSVEEPTTQTVVRGPREGFTEKLSTNKALLRKRIRSHNLRLETMTLGTFTKTNVSIAFIHGIADENIVMEVRDRIKKIDVDGIIASNTIEEIIQDKTFTPFPTVANTERPDVLAAALLEGRVAIMVDGTPFSLIVPVVFIQFFQTAEDYFSRTPVGSLTRLLRYLAFLISLLAPAMYIAVTTFHHEMVPRQLLSNIAAQREGVPFPAFVEALLMEITFEILREAGIRMPKTVGQAVSVVGAIVIGQAAVEAGFVSAAMVIVVAITAISSFVLPSYNMANSVRILRFFVMFLAASFGYFGIMLAIFTIIIHLCSLRSFGVSYMSPLAPFYFQDQKDAFIRLPKKSFSSKGEYIKKENRH